MLAPGSSISHLQLLRVCVLCVVCDTTQKQQASVRLEEVWLVMQRPQKHIKAHKSTCDLLSSQCFIKTAALEDYKEGLSSGLGE